MFVAMESSAGAAAFGGGAAAASSAAAAGPGDCGPDTAAQVSTADGDIADATAVLSAPPTIPRVSPTDRQQREARREARLQEKSEVLSTANYSKALAAGKLAQENAKKNESEKYRVALLSSAKRQGAPLGTEESPTDHDTAKRSRPLRQPHGDDDGNEDGM